MRVSFLTVKSTHLERNTPLDRPRTARTPTKQSSCVTARGVPPAPPTFVSPFFFVQKKKKKKNFFQKKFFQKKFFCQFFLSIFFSIFCQFFFGGGPGGGGGGGGGGGRGGPTLPMHCGIGPPPPCGQTHKVKT